MRMLTAELGVSYGLYMITGTTINPPATGKTQEGQVDICHLLVVQCMESVQVRSQTLLCQ